MDTVSVRDLRNKGGEVLDRVEHGEVVVVTRDGRAIAQLQPLPRRSPSPSELIARRRHLAPVDPDRLRNEIDSVLDATL